MSETTQPLRAQPSQDLLSELADLGIRVSDQEPSSGGALFDDLRLLYPVGKGGMGVVLRGRDDALDIDVAVKVISSIYADDDHFIARLISEARSIARLDHPNIVRVLRIGEYLRQHYIVMEFINGHDVHNLIQRRGALPALEAATIAASAASALVYAHRKSLIHRDVKPHNILVSQDREKIKLVDFGIARDFTQKASQNSKIAAMGTPLYMSPEQLHGEEADENSDIYSLGITLYNMLAGDVTEELQMRVFDPGRLKHRGLSVERTQTPRDTAFFNDLIESMCEPEPKDRPLLIDVLSSLEEFVQRSAPSHEVKTRASSAPRPRKSTTEVLRGNLREPLSTFVGRQRELATLAELFGLQDPASGELAIDQTVEAREPTRLITILGSGGTGKTRLAQRFAALYRDHFPGGIWFVDLSSARRVEDICHAIAGTLKLGLKSVENPIELLGNALAGQAKNADGPLLLILDNFEQCSQFADATLSEWLRASPNILILVTSRILLGIEGEHEFALGAMGMPPLDALLPFADEGTKTLARQYENFDAVRLFLARARAGAPDTSIERDHLPAVVEICRRLDGNPLALELAASRIKVLPPQKLLERLDNRFELLRSDRRNAGKRQSTLRSTIDWSWDLLEAWERSALSQLSTFAAGFTLEAAESVIDLNEFAEAPPIMDVVQSLRDKSLILRSDPESPRLDLRFGLFESIREYANERKAEQLDDDELIRLHLRFGQYFIRFAQELNDEVLGVNGLIALDKLELEIQNFLSAQTLFLEMQAPVLAAQAICAASVVMHVRGPHAARVRRLKRSLEAINSKDFDIGKLGVPEEQALYNAFSPAPAWVDPEIDAMQVLAQTIEVLCNLTTAYLDEGDTLSAERAAERAVNLARGLLSALEDPSHETLWKRGSKFLSRALDSLSAVEERRANYAHALTLLEEAEEIERELEDENGLAQILSSRGNVKIRSGDADGALNCYREAESICRQTNNKIGLTINVSNRGWVALSLGLLDDAMRCFNEGESLSRELRFNNGLAWNIGCRGAVHKARGEFDDALRCYFEAEGMFRDMGVLVSQAHNIGNRGGVYADLGRYEEALACFAEAEGIARKIGDQENLSFWVGSRASVLARQGHATAALKAYAEAEARSDAINSRTRLASFLAGRASVYLKLGRIEEALLLLEESYGIAKEYGTTATENHLNTISLLARAHFDMALTEGVEDREITRRLRKTAMTHGKAAELYLVEGLSLANSLGAPTRPPSSETFAAYARLTELSNEMKTP